MTTFWILAAGLVVASLAVLLRPLLRSGGAGVVRDAQRDSNVRILREQLAELDAELAAGTLAADQHAAARAEIERRVLDETRDPEVAIAARPACGAAAALAVLLPVSAALIYLALGNRDAVDSVLARAPSEATAQDVETLVERLAERMREQPDDPEGWALLGRSYASMGRFEPARDAYAKAVALVPDNPSLLADYADTLAMAQGRRLQGEPERLVPRALEIEPDHLKALLLAGAAAMERGDHAAAVERWSRAKQVAPSDSPLASGLDEGLRRAAGRRRGVGGAGCRGACGLAAGPRHARPGAGRARAAGRYRLRLRARRRRAARPAGDRPAARRRAAGHGDAGRYDGDVAADAAVVVPAGRRRGTRVAQRRGDPAAGRSRGAQRCRGGPGAGRHRRRRDRAGPAVTGGERRRSRIARKPSARSRRPRCAPSQYNRTPTSNCQVRRISTTS